MCTISHYSIYSITFSKLQLIDLTVVLPQTLSSQDLEVVIIDILTRLQHKITKLGEVKKQFILEK